MADCLFPFAEKFTAADLARRKRYEDEQIKKAEEIANPSALTEAYATLQSEDEDRLKSVEGRLGGLLSLTSLTATLLFSGILAIANGTLGDASRMVRVAAAGAVFYLSCQIVCSTLASVRRLSRAAWLRPDVEDLMPAIGISAETDERRKAVNACKRYLASDQTINYKVTQMAVAHTAVRNFAVASAVIAVLGVSIILTQDRSKALSREIQRDSQLQQLLRGQAGTPGPAGPPGVCMPERQDASKRVPPISNLTRKR